VSFSLLKICVKPEDKEVALKTILTVARTGANGEIGDGKVFVSTIDEAVRIRTEEKGVAAV